MSASSPTLARRPAQRPAAGSSPAARTRSLLHLRAVLAGLFVLAAAYHWLQSRAHLTPAVFTDELLFSKLAQSIAAGDGLTIRGEPFLFPPLLPSLVQAPVWLLDGAEQAYGALKAVNALVMAAAVFPAYWLARQLVRRSFALMAAAATVAAPAMLYHTYLMSEALAYPVFLLALGTMVRAVARPSLRWELAVVGVSLLAVATRMQFAFLPLAYLAAAPLAGRLCGLPLRAALRSHAVSIGTLLLLGALALLSGGGALGFYQGAIVLDYSSAHALRWAAYTGALVLFSAGWLVVPGAALGLALLAARPRGRADAAFALLSALAAAAALLQAGLLAGLEYSRALERYAIYLVPLAFMAFFAYAERGAPRRRVYAGLSFVLAGLALFVPLPALSRASFSFDSPVLSAYERLSSLTTAGDAAVIFSGGAFVSGLLLAAVPLRRRAPAALACASIAVCLVLGIGAYAGDHAMTRVALRDFAGSPPAWLDESGVGRADFLALEGSSPHAGWMVEAWNRSVGRNFHLGARTPPDPLPFGIARVSPYGLLLVEGRPIRGGHLVVADYATQIELNGRVVLRPRRGLTLLRVPAATRVRSLASGLYFDRWASAVLRYQVWPAAPSRTGRYRVRLALPRGREPRRVELTVARGIRRSLTLRPGGSALVELEAPGQPVPVLQIRTDRADFVDAGTPHPRLVALRIPSITYVSGRRSARRRSA